MTIEKKLSEKTIEALQSLYNTTVEKVTFEKTNPDFTGDLTLVVFSFLKISKKKPEETATEIGNYLKTNVEEVVDFNVIKGFLNIVIDDKFWLNYLKSISDKPFIAPPSPTAPIVMVEYSSPNTNKPLHLGHVRNNLLGYSVSEILKAAGNRVIKTNLVNDRGIHICKSMLAWQKWGNGETPESSSLKGDHLVGKYYVEFDKHYNTQANSIIENWENGIFENSKLEKQYSELLIKSKTAKDEDTAKKIKAEIKDLAKANTNIYQEAQQMLFNWEAGDLPTKELWKMMNGWVYKGFEETYNMLGVNFDKTYFESNTYLLGKNIIDEGLSKGILKRRADNSVFIDLTADGLDEKTLLRADGTSVYMTQDLGTAVQRAEEEHFNKLVYTVANEQDYHFKVLFLILHKMGYQWANGLFHLSYGMVELPEGKMKSREGTVVDADELMQEMIATAASTTQELGKAQDLSKEDAEKLYRTIGLGALKYFILKVDPKKKMLFNPAESIDFNGNTAPFIQFNYVRIQALLRKAKDSFQIQNTSSFKFPGQLLPKEKALIIKLYEFTATLNQAALEYSPALIANYVYDLAKEYSQYYHDTPIFKEEQQDLILFRLHLSSVIGEAIKASMQLLGIDVPERM